MGVDTEHLERILNRIHDWIRAADTKASIVGLMQTATAALLADNLPHWFAADVSGTRRLITWIAVCLWVASVAMTTLAILWKGAKPVRQSMLFFGDITKWPSAHAYADYVKQISDADLVSDYTDQIYISSIICGDKYWYLRRGIWFFLGSLITAALAILSDGVAQ
jgi:hypothetical protein